MFADVRYACRQMLKAPGFTATIVVTLALGIGACVTIFSVVDTQLLTTYMPADERPVWFFSKRENATMGMSPADFADVRKRAKSFEVLCASSGVSLFLIGEGEPRQLNGSRVTPGWFKIYPTQMQLGRDFLPEEMEPGKDHVAIIGYGLWQSAFGGAPDILGRSVNVGGEMYTVVGVTPDWFKRTNQITEMWVPLSLTPTQLADRGGRYLGLRARLQRGVTLEQASAELDVIGAQLAQQFPTTNADVKFTVVEGHSFSQRGNKPVLWTLFGAVVALLLIACANVANLLLTRATVRQREISVRAALGATRGRLIRQLLVESLLLAGLAGVAGLLLAKWGLDALRWQAGVTPALSVLRYIELDRRMLVFALLVSAATAIVSGLAPAWLASRVDLNEALKQGGRGNTGARSWLRQALVAFEVACALVLLTGAGLLMRSSMLASRVALGFEMEGASALTLNLRSNKYRNPAQRTAFMDGVLAKLRGLPGVASAGVVQRLPVRGVGYGLAFSRDSKPDVKPVGANTFVVTPGYAEAMRLRLIRGRFFSERDDPRGGRVLLINETLARQHFPGEDPVGKLLLIGRGGNQPPVPTEIVGVVADVWEGEAGRAVGPQLYEPFTQTPVNWNSFTFVVRAAGARLLLAADLKAQVYAVDAEQPVQNVVSLEDAAAERGTMPRFQRNLLTIFAAIALVIATIGIYGVISFMVSQRTVEIGIRMALGGQRADIARLIIAHGARLVIVGLVVGVAGALALGQVIQSWLVDLSARDPVTLVVTPLVFFAVGLLACCVPAWRATRVDPVVALRAE